MSTVTLKVRVPAASLALTSLTVRVAVSVSVMSVLAVAVVMLVVPLALTALESCRASASVPSTRASSAAVRSKLNEVPTKVSSKVSVWASLSCAVTAIELLTISGINFIKFQFCTFHGRHMFTPQLNEARSQAVGTASQ